MYLVGRSGDINGNVSRVRGKLNPHMTFLLTITACENPKRVTNITQASKRCCFVILRRQTPIYPALQVRSGGDDSRARAGRIAPPGKPCHPIDVCYPRGKRSAERAVTSAGGFHSSALHQARVRYLFFSQPTARRPFAWINSSSRGHQNTQAQ